VALFTRSWRASHSSPALTTGRPRLFALRGRCQRAGWPPILRHGPPPLMGATSDLQNPTSECRNRNRNRSRAGAVCGGNAWGGMLVAQIIVPGAYLQLPPRDAWKAGACSIPRRVRGGSERDRRGIVRCFFQVSHSLRSASSWDILLSSEEEVIPSTSP